MKIETNLSINIDNSSIEYGKIPSFLIKDDDYVDQTLVYYFKTNDEDKHKELVDKLVDILKQQSYDHGSEWRVTKRDTVESDKYVQISLVAFRIKDSY